MSAPAEAPSGPTILLVDDDPDMLTALRLHLRGDGYQVVTAGTVAAAVQLVQDHLPHAAVLDLRLPDGSGLDVAAALRQLAAVPIILLTAVDDEETKVLSLNESVDDYVTKPFRAREVSARLRSVLRRAWPAGHPTADTLRLDNATVIDLPRRRLLREGQDATHLSPTESRLLWLLVSNAGQVLPVQTLLTRGWPDGRGSVGSLWEYIRRLREKLGDDPSSPRYIITERDLGYRFRRGEGGEPG